MLNAHLINNNGTFINQTLKVHCYNVATMASNQLKCIDLYNVTFISGLLHDLGKATQKFNDYLEKSSNGEQTKVGSVNHTFAGAIYILEKYHDKNVAKNLYINLTTEIIAYVIGAHHGSFDCVNLEGENGFDYRLQKDKKEICYEEAKINFFNNVANEEEIKYYFDKSVIEIQNMVQKIQKNNKYDSTEFYFQLGLLSRLILSAVRHADQIDTSNFMLGKNDDNNTVDWSYELKQFEVKIQNFDNSNKLNKIRSSISTQCYDFASNKNDIYCLNVPTGGGKTLSSLRYALRHSMLYKKDKIIFIIPLLSIIDQNAKIIKQYMSSPNLVLESHSNVENDDNDDLPFKLDSWDESVIVSTLVQLLDIFYTSKSKDISRFCTLVNSTIVIDEVQTIPQKMMYMFNVTLNFLKECCKCTIILSSATQPTFDNTEHNLKINKELNMVTLSKEEQDIFDRYRIVNRTDKYGYSIDEIVENISEIMKKNRSLLVVCNTKREAKDIFTKLDKEKFNIFHLSTSMCKKHRENVLEELNENLKACLDKNSRKVICVSTQLIEAGVDISFESVIRLLAGIDNIAQSAGRCNRSYEYGKMGSVYLYNIKNENLTFLKEIEIAKQSTIRLLTELNNTSDLFREKSIKKYFNIFFGDTAINKMFNYPLENDPNISLYKYLSDYSLKKYHFNNYIIQQPFKTAGDLFKVFDTETYDVVVPYRDGEKIINELNQLNINYEYDLIYDCIKRLKQYTVQVYRWELEKLKENGMLYSICDGKIMCIQVTAYSNLYGLDSTAEYSINELII